MARRMTLTARGLLLGLAWVLTACQGGAARTTPQVESVEPRLTGAAESAAGEAANRDPCAARLHDLCGPLLLYVATQGRLPDTLAELEGVTPTTAPASGTPAPVCPVTRRPYLYSPSGGLAASPLGRVIACDAVAHAGRRWGIAIAEGTAGDPLVAKVVPLEGKR